MRDSVLQELFTLRRGLELTALDPQFPAGVADRCQTWLSQTETLQQLLEQLSYQLAPPYIEESLPLALQYLLEPWKLRYPDLQIQLQILANGLAESAEHNQILVTILDEFFQMVLPSAASHSPLQVCLHPHAQGGELTIQLSYADETNQLAIHQMPELQHLQQVVRWLAAGCWTCEQLHQPPFTDRWHLIWQST